MKRTPGAKKKERVVFVSMHLPEEIFELLYDVSLSRHISGVASKVGNDDTKSNAYSEMDIEGIARVVIDLVERHQNLLQDEAAKAGVRKRRSSTT